MRNRFKSNDVMGGYGMLRILALLAVLGVPSAHAAKYTIDKEHSNVAFKIRHLASRVPGSFTDFSGSFEFSEKDPQKSSLETVIQVASINTRNADRDGHLRTADFFDADKFPTATFKSAKVAGAGKDRFKVNGVLNLHGVEKPVVLDVEYLGTAKNFKGKTTAGFSAKGKFNRKDFGIVWNKVLDTGSAILGDEVELSIEVEALQD